MIVEQLSKYRIGGIFGTGRSGSTWLGSIVNSHPDIVYRFEPFHVLHKTNSEIAEALQLIRSDTLSHQDIPQIYQALLPAHSELEKPPFFSKSFPMRLPIGRSLLWFLSQKNLTIKRFFCHTYTPTSKPMLVFKEVGYIDVFSRLLTKTEIPLVYLMRHPCAVVSSNIRGQNSNLMPSKRRSVLYNLLQKYNPKLAEKYRDNIDSLTIVEQETLLWIVEVEESFRACQNKPQGLLVIYEELVENPLEVTQRIFKHFDLSMPQASINFIQESTSRSSLGRIQRGEWLRNQYFSVFRDPKIARDSWRDKMSSEEQKQVQKIVQDSEAFQFGVKLGLWD